MNPLIYSRTQRRNPKFTRFELARMFWRAAYYVRRQRPHDQHTHELLAYLEREFRAMWPRSAASKGSCIR
jgi:hypothetical protein